MAETESRTHSSLLAVPLSSRVRMRGVRKGRDSDGVSKVGLVQGTWGVSLSPWCVSQGQSRALATCLLGWPGQPWEGSRG